jgi:hypothetical protein
VGLLVCELEEALSEAMLAELAVITGGRSFWLREAARLVAWVCPSDPPSGRSALTAS